MNINNIICGNTLEVLKTFPDKCIDSIITSPPYYQLRRYAGIPDYVWGNKNCEHEFISGINKFALNIPKTINKNSWDRPSRDAFENTSIDSVCPICKNMFEAKPNQRFCSKECLNTLSNNDRQNYTQPSNICTKCGAWKGQLGLEPTYKMFLDHLILIITECKRVLKDTGTMFINLGDSYNSSPIGKQVDPKRKVQGGGFSYEHKKNVDKTIPNKCLMLIPHRFAIKCVDELGLILRNDIIWAKRNGMPESVRDRFSKKHEFFFFFTKQQKYYFDLDGVRDNATSTNKTYKAINTTQNKYAITNGLNRGGINANGKNPGDVSDFWDIPTQPSSAKHYATFNTKLIDKPIVAGSPEKGIILDPFCGSGTTLVRGLQLDRKVIGIDGSKEYCLIAQERIDKELNQLRLGFIDSK